MRYARAAVLAALLLVLVPWGGPSSASDTAATALGVITKDVLVVDNNWGVNRITDDTQITWATTKDDGELHLSNVWFGPPVGQRFAGGTAYDVAAERTASVGSIGNVCRTFQNQMAAVKSGTLTVDDVQYDGDTVTSIAASWIVECANSNGSTTSQGFVRLASDAPHPLVAPAPVDMPEAGRSKPVEATVTLTNTGDAATGMLGSATIDPAIAGGQYYTVGTDRCAGTDLAPDQSCTVDVTFERATEGYAHGRIAVVAPGYPGGKILATAAGEVIVAPTEAPVATPFPVLKGQGIKWVGDWRATWFQVERRLGSVDWENVSGRLGGTVKQWVDHTLPPGSEAEYRVFSGNADGVSPASAVVMVTGLAAIEAGTVRALSVDADGSSGSPTDQVATSFEESWDFDSRQRQLYAGQFRIRIPDLLPGPGNYEVAPGAAHSVTIRQNFDCPVAGTLRVDQLAYSDDFRPIATLTATVDGVCRTADGDGPRVVVELRVNSAQPLAAVAFSPVDAGRVTVDQHSAPKPVSIRNTGTAQVELGQPSVAGTTAGDWTIHANHCPAVLAAGATCTVDVVASPLASGLRTAQLELTDSTTRGRHHAALAVTGVGTAGPPKNLKAIGTLTGVDLSWGVPTDNGQSEVTGYTVHRLVDGIETTFEVERVGEQTTTRWTDTNPPAGATYAVSARNEVGDGEQTATQAPRHTSDVLAYSNGSLQQWALPGGTQPVPVGSGTPAQGVTDVAASNDGRYLAYAEGDAIWSVRADSPASSAPVRLTSTAGVRDISWSPDRSRLAFTHTEGEQLCVSIIAITGGDPVKVRCGIEQPSWLPDARTLVVVGGGALQRVDAKGDGAILGTYPDTMAGFSPQVSPDGRWIAYSTFVSGPHVNLIPLVGGSPSSVAVFEHALSLTWAPAADRLVFGTPVGRPGIIPVTADGALGTPTGLLADDDVSTTIADPVWQGLGVAIAPTAALTGPVVSILFDTSALSSGTTSMCRLDSGTWATCTSPYRATGLSGGNHTLAVKAIEPSGRTVVASRSFSVDATGPVAQVLSPTYETTTTGAATVRYSASDSVGAASYDVRYRRASYLSGFGAYVQPWTNVTVTSVNLPLDPGYEYCVSVRAKDKLGNLGAWTAEKCFARPMDDRVLAAPTAGWSRTSWSAFYLGTATQTTSYGASLTRTVQGKRFYLVATKCPACGLVAVYAGGKYVGAVNLASATTQRQAVIPLPVQSTVFSGTLTFTVRSATGKFVQIDGLAVRRT